jgi:hypothetical protein
VKLSFVFIIVSIFLTGGCVPSCDPQLTQEVLTTKLYRKDLEITVYDERTGTKHFFKGTGVVPYSTANEFKIRTKDGQADMDEIFITTCARVDHIEDAGSREWFELLYDNDFENKGIQCAVEFRTVDYDDEKHALGTIDREHPSLTLSFKEKCNARMLKRQGVGRCHSYVNLPGFIEFNEPVKCYTQEESCEKYLENEKNQKFWFKMPKKQVVFRFYSASNEKARFILDPYNEILYRSR